ncbi:MAG: hypothetical protein KDJ52_24020 [Anaerolineae bacterium]|nr:hypothetical protein [Anaerolineae bacterium]
MRKQLHGSRAGAAACGNNSTAAGQSMRYAARAVGGPDDDIEKLDAHVRRLVRHTHRVAAAVMFRKPTLCYTLSIFFSTSL